ncbi:MAG: hypothetical protein C4522_11780 [Desulfobacteraceae bacterium]|nr:MAG: hypothetical protein C4522_11780 [Desulfobacteraceae bacterium]
MPQTNKIAPFVLTVIIGVALQILFIFPDIKDTPSKAAIEFTEAFFKADQKTMTERMCGESKTINGIDVIDRYIHKKTREASDLGYGMFYMKNSVTDLRTHIISRDDSSVELRLTGKAKPVLKSFFTGEDAKPIDEIIRVINDNGKWKVCGNVFSIAGL